MNFHRITFVAILLIASLAGTTCQSTKQDFTKENAAVFFDEYLNALSTGDSSKVKIFWSKESLAREGFWLMHVWRGAFMPFSQWPEFLQNFEHKITNVRFEKDYYKIELEWIQKETAENAKNYQPRKMLYYVIWENGHWVLINPIDVLARDWQIYETECFTFHHPPETNVRDYLAELSFMDQECEKALKVFEIELTSKIDFYKARTLSECGDLLLQTSSNGYAAVGYTSPEEVSWDRRGFGIVVSTSFINPHEVVHLLTALAGIPFLNAAFVEGIASAFGGNTQTTAELTLTEARNLLDHPMHFRLKDLLTMSDADFLRNNFVTYYEAGAFVRFLVDRFGMDKLKTLCRETQSSEELDKMIPATYGYSIEELEAQLKEYLLERELPQLEFTIPSEAELVFSMSDPVGDDMGDGDYAYPRDQRFKQGVFDLTNFEVLKDSTRAYFRLEFHNMIEPVTYGSSSEKFVPGTIIAINKSSAASRHVQRYCHGVQFEGDEGYDLKLNVGLAISVSNDFGKVYFSTSEVYDRIADSKTNTIEFSLPIDFIGEPERDWKYFVGVGLVSDRTMNFLNGGLFPVYKKHPVFISGGNYDYGDPAFIDILLPENNDQAETLSDYDAEKGKRATMPMVGVEDWVLDAKRRGEDLFAVALKGMPRNRGILPDYAVEPKIADLIDGRDTVKAFALSLIEKSVKD